MEDFKKLISSLDVIKQELIILNKKIKESSQATKELEIELNKITNRPLWMRLIY